MACPAESSLPGRPKWERNNIRGSLDIEEIKEGGGGSNLPPREEQGGDRRTDKCIFPCGPPACVYGLATAAECESVAGALKDYGHSIPFSYLSFLPSLPAGLPFSLSPPHSFPFFALLFLSSTFARRIPRTGRGTYSFFPLAHL